MTIASHSSSFVLDRYPSVNLPGSWESWDQNMDDKRRILCFGATFCPWRWLKKCLCDPHRQWINNAEKNRTHWRAKSIWLSDSHAVLSFNLSKSRSGSSWSPSILKLRPEIVRCGLWFEVGEGSVEKDDGDNKQRIAPCIPELETFRCSWRES